MSLRFLTVILICQLCGETATVALALPVPGPVLGMVMLFFGLVVRGAVPAGLASTAGGILQHLSLLFVPAGVGVMLHASLLAEQWLALSVSLFTSTVLTVAVTAWTMKLVVQGDRPRRGHGES